MKLNIDLVIGIGLVATLILSVLLNIFGAGSIELQTTIASGLIGYLGRIAVERVSKEKEEKQK